MSPQPMRRERLPGRSLGRSPGRSPGRSLGWPGGSSRAAAQRGIALIAVLWGIAILSIIAAAFLAETRSRGAIARNLLENAKAQALADAGVYRAISGILSIDPVVAWRADGTAYPLALGEGDAVITIVDEGGKVDLNRAQDRLLSGLLEVLGVPEDERAALVDAIRDFADRDDNRRPAGAEDGDYISAGLERGAKDAPFESVEELQQVLGITRPLYDRLAPFLTVYSGRAQINPVVAPREVLMAMPGLGADQVDALLARRTEGADARVRSVGTAFTIRADATTAGGGRFVREAVVQRTADRRNPYLIREWRHFWASQPASESGGG